MNIELTEKERRFFEAYKEAIYFTDTGDIGQAATDAELCEVFERESLIDCLSFYQRIACFLSDDNIEQAGHDFWLTRNGHGAGFWDGDYSEKHEAELMKACEPFKEQYLFNNGHGFIGIE